ncbi:MAG: hypothetical protein DSY77_08405 [Bacteroidetes bacterium]|nr:MAG: hypothetical protein DSY77_08405 [Bacteroidota bacterium]
MLKRIKLNIIISLMFVGATFQLQAQDLSQIGKGKALKVNGGISLSQLYNTAFGGELNREPYSYYFNGNINFSIYGLSIPLSFNFSNEQFGYSQPFNQYGISPTYEWITLQAGYTSMSFSPYTLSGHLFLGGGVQLRPDGPWSVSAMAGRLQKAIAVDTAVGNQPAFHRFGYGSKVDYQGNGYNLNFTFFKSKDDPSTVTNLTDSMEVFPEENLVLGIGGSTTLFQRVALNFEYANSAISRDIRSEGVERGTFQPFPSGGALFTHRLSTAYHQAFKTGVNYGGNGYNIGLGYERVDPGYKTHGAYFFNNDLENITVNGGTQLFKNKLNISTNIGLQRDNLDDAKINQMTRWIGAVNSNWTVSKKLNVSASYSNFQTYTVIRSQFEDINNIDLLRPIDTLNFTQISQSINASSNYILKADESRVQSLNLNLSVQQSSDEQSGEEQPTGSKFYNSNLGFSNQWKELGLNIFTSFNASWQEAGEINNTTLGPVLSVNKSMFEKKLRLSLTSAFNNSYAQSNLTNTVFNCRLSAAYQYKEKHNISFTNAFLARNTPQDDGSTNKSTQLNGTLTYTYQF